MYNDRNLEFVSLEKEFEVPMPTPSGRTSRRVVLGGRFDGVVKHIPSGEYWIWETKTTRSVKELIRSLVNDEQCGVYMYAASKMLRVPIVGVLYNIIRKKVPARPRVLQSGLLSKAENVDTTTFFYKHCIQELFPDWQDSTIDEYFGDILGTLHDKEQDFFMRYPIHRSSIEIKNLMQNVYYTAVEMTRKNIPLYPSPSWITCTFCGFKSPCITMNAGGAYQVLLDEEYQQRIPFEAVEEEAEEHG